MPPMENYSSELDFETTDSGLRVAGTGLPRLRAAADAGGARAGGGWRLWLRKRGWERRVGKLDSTRSDPYLQEHGPGNVPRLTRLRMDLGGYGSGKTKDECGTEPDARAISESTQNWAGFSLRVLTQNLWALPVISKCLEARIHAFSKTLGGEWDVIALQEVWHARERDALRRAALLAGLRYSRHFEQGCGAPISGPGSGGTGLLLLSRFPISESVFKRFSANGQPYQVSHSDYLGGKGVGLARLHTPAGLVDVYVAHLHADYSRGSGPEGIDRYKAHRVSQAFEVAHFIRLTSKSPLVVLMTDLNAGPGSLSYGMQRSVAGLGDAFSEAKPGQVGYTCETADNVFSNGRDPPARIDFVLFKPVPPPLCAPQPVEPTWELKDCWLHKAYIPPQDAAGLLPSHMANAPRQPSPPAATPASATSTPTMTTTAAAVNRPHIGGRGASGRSVGERQSSGRVSGGSGRVSGGSGASSIASESRGIERRINISDHFGVAAEFIARDPASEDFDHDERNTSADNAGGSISADSPSGLNNLPSEASEANIGGGHFPQGPLLARALTEIDLGVQAAKRRREHHLHCAKVLAVAWTALVAAGTATSTRHPLGYLARVATSLLGGLLSAAATTLFLAYWLSSKEELQGLKEVYQTAKNYDRHLPMEEAFPDGGFDASQINSYMEQHFR